jgi:predicted amidophosphoribosyltransferase
VSPPSKAESLEKPERFVWPPSGEPVEVLAPEPKPEPEPSEPRVSGVVRTIEAVEEAWVGVRARSFTRRAQLSGWSPTAAWEACWRCGGPVGAHEADGDGCASCRAQPVPWGRFLSVGPYEGDLAAAIRELKFSGWRLLGRQMGALLGERISEELAKHRIEPREAVIVPVASSWRSRVGRGIDHTGVLAAAAGRSSGVPVVRCLRRRHGPSQTSVSASRRAENVRGVFRRGRSGAGLGDRLGDLGVVIVVDDIRTTGATLREAVKTVRGVKRSNAAEGLGIERVWAGAVAVAGGAERRGNAGFVGDSGVSG